MWGLGSELKDEGLRSRFTFCSGRVHSQGLLGKRCGCQGMGLGVSGLGVCGGAWGLGLSTLVVEGLGFGA